MIYRAIQLIQIFLAHGRTNGRTKVIQEVLVDLKTPCICRLQQQKNQLTQLEIHVQEVNRSTVCRWRGVEKVERTNNAAGSKAAVRVPGRLRLIGLSSVASGFFIPSYDLIVSQCQQQNLV